MTLSWDAHLAREADRHYGADRPEVDEDVVANFAAGKVEAALADLTRGATVTQRREELLALAESVAATWSAYEDGDLDKEAMAEAAEAAGEARACAAEDAAEARRYGL